MVVAIGMIGNSRKEHAILQFVMMLACGPIFKGECACPGNQGAHDQVKKLVKGGELPLYKKGSNNHMHDDVFACKSTHHLSHSAWEVIMITGKYEGVVLITLNLPSLWV